VHGGGAVISHDLRTKIRRLYFGEHWKIGTIVSQLGVHHDTVAAAIESNRFRNVRFPERASCLDTYKPMIDAWLAQYPRLRSTRITEMLKPRGYTGGAATVRRYVRTVRRGIAHEAFLRLETLPGEQAQVDWAHFGKIRIGRAMRTLSLFVMVLSWSRAMFARFALDQSMESFLRGHVHAFEALGGAARTILYDNLKSAVLERDGDHVRFHPRLLDLAGHYHFQPRPCAPYRGNEKGKVERRIQDIRHSFFAARSYTSVADLNQQMLDWIDRVAHTRNVPGDPSRLVCDGLGEERARLLSLPEHSFECDLVCAVRSGKTPYIRFDGNDYSIPHDRIRQPLTLIASESAIRIAEGATVLARHARSYDRALRIDDPVHINALVARKRHAQALRGRDRLRTACPSADRFIAALATRGLSMARHTTRLIKLLDQYGASELDAAITDAFSRGAISADSVAHVIDQRARARQQLPPIEMELPDDPRIRDLRVTPHRLADYDNLANWSDATTESADD
jgi:transposase